MRRGVSGAGGPRTGASWRVLELGGLHQPHTHPGHTHCGSSKSLEQGRPGTWSGRTREPQRGGGLARGRGTRAEAGASFFLMECLPPWSPHDPEVRKPADDGCSGVHMVAPVDPFPGLSYCVTIWVISFLLPSDRSQHGDAGSSLTCLTSPKCRCPWPSLTQPLSVPGP